MNEAPAADRITVDWLLGIVASNPTPAVITRAIETAYALGQRDCALEALKQTGTPQPAGASAS